jgi:hypothetical protein
MPSWASATSEKKKTKKKDKNFLSPCMNVLLGRVLPTSLPLHSFSVTLFALGFRLF